MNLFAIFVFIFVKRQIRNSALFVAIVILMLHSFTPHHHSLLSDRDVPTISSHQCPQNLFNGLFNVDLGENHLEEYKISNVGFDLTTTFVINSIPELTQKLEVETNSVAVTNPYPLQDSSSDFVNENHGLRAPPNSDDIIKVTND